MLPVGNCVQRSAKKRRGETMEAIFLTDRGKVRQHNEDNGGIFQHANDLLLVVVADGMGGHKAGDVASQMAVTELENLWGSLDDCKTPEEAKTWLLEAIQHVNEKVFQYAEENEECQGMGTTLVVALCAKEFVTIGHIGDSRCYIKNSNGFTQKTNDHSLVYELVRSGQISKEDAEFHPRKNVLMRALGTEKEINVDITVLEWEEEDFLLLCSDGLTNKISDKELEEVLSEQISVENQAKRLIDRANELGGEDNISVAVVKYSTSVSGSE